MPNDNTHTLLPCPFCGDTPAPIDKVTETPINRHFNDGCPLSGLIFTDEEWNTRTPAEPKAGDWEKEINRLYEWVADYERYLGRDPDRDMIVHGMEELLDHIRAVGAFRRALSSAAPRITERGMNEDWWSEAVDTYFAEHADGKREMPPGAYLRRHWEEDTGYWCNELVHIRQGEDWTTGDIDTMWIGPFPEWVFNAPAPLSGITGDSDKSDLPIANSVQLSEEMVERVHDEVWGEYSSGKLEFYNVPHKIRDRIIALLRQRPPFTPTQTEE